MREFLAILFFTVLLANWQPKGITLWLTLWALLFAVGVAIELDKD